MIMSLKSTVEIQLDREMYCQHIHQNDLWPSLRSVVSNKYCFNLFSLFSILPKLQIFH